MHAMGSVQGLARTDQQAARSVRKEKPLVRIERDGISSLDTGQLLASSFGQLKKTAVGSVHVKPELLSLGNIGQGLQWIDSPRVGAAALANKQKWGESVATILGDRLFQLCQVHSTVVVGLNAAHAGGGEPRQVGGSQYRMVRLPRGINGSFQEVLGKPATAGGENGRPVGQ